MYCAPIRVLKSVETSSTCGFGEFDGSVVVPRLSACLNLCAFLENAQLVAISETGRRRRNWVCCLPSVPPSLHEGECVCVCLSVSGSTAGVGQSVNAADSYRRFPGYQSCGKHRVDSLWPQCSGSGICLTGTKRLESWTVVE